MASIYDLPHEIINIIIFDNLKVKDILSCLNTAKIFHILNKHQLEAINKTSNGWGIIV